ncbi:MAG TPA: hypothetical protein DCE18_19250, partial [Syntrophobacteraceae bacterium]|nr:hypothetical protein [Syntrophobacteraceae bacterium]
AADAKNDNTDPLVSQVLYNNMSFELRNFRDQFPQQVEVFITNPQGVSIASTNRTSDYYQGDEEWWQTAYKQGLYIGQPEYDESSGIMAVIMALPIRENNTGSILGILRTTINFATLSDSLVAGRFGETGRTILYLPGGQMISLAAGEGDKLQVVNEAAPDILQSLTGSNAPYLTLDLDGVPTLTGQAKVQVPGLSTEAEAITQLNWRMITQQDEQEALEAVTAQTRYNLIVALVVIIASALAAFGLARVITNPIVQLKSVAARVASGDLTAEAKVTTRDEVGTLATTFNAMTSQLRNLVGSLEQRVADRTHDLELASEVGRAVTEKVADMDDMLTSAAEMIRTRFGLYYTQVYLTDSNGSLLLLSAGTGEVGEALLKRGHHLTIDYNSLNGRAALEKKPVIVADTLKSSFFKPNPLLPKTRSEMAVPLISANRILGVLDMQAEESGTLSEANLPAFEALAGQLAIAIQNARLFAETEQARAEVESQARRLTRTGWSDYLNAIQKPEQTGYIYDQNQIVPMTEAEQSVPSAAGMLSAPIEVSGEPIGSFQVELEQEKRTVQTRELVQSVVRQVARQVENLRLLEMAERYRVEAENITRRLTHEGWDVFQKRSNTTSGYVFDLNQVKPLSDSGTGGLQGALIHPLAVRDEIIGEIHVDDVHHNDDDGELIEAVSRQLSAHIENIRLSDLNEKRAREMETVADLSATTSTVLDPDKLLQSVVDRTKESFGVYHAHIYLTDDKAKILILTAGAGETGQKMVAETHSIAMNAEKSLVARAVRERSAVIVNDVRADPGFLPNPLLPETRSEMAVPMIIGDRVLGVFDVQADVTGYFTDEDASIFSTLASQVAVALQNAKLFDETQLRSQELSALNQIITTASQTLDLNTILETVLGKVLSTINFSAGLISLFNQATGILELAAISNMPAPLENRFRTKGFGGTLCAYVADTKQSLSIGDLELGGPVDVRGLISNGFRSYLGAPIISKGHILGTLCLFNSNPQEISSALLLLVESMAGQLGIAIENALLYAEQSATVTQLRELDRLKSSFLANMS